MLNNLKNINLVIKNTNFLNKLYIISIYLIKSSVRAILRKNIKTLQCATQHTHYQVKKEGLLCNTIFPACAHIVHVRGFACPFKRK